MGCVPSTVDVDTNRGGGASERSYFTFDSKRWGQSSPIMRSVSNRNQFISNKDRTNIMSEEMSMTSKLLLNPPFSNFSSFTNSLFMTGYSGLTIENLKINFIKYLINVAVEIPDISARLERNNSIVWEKYPVRKFCENLKAKLLFLVGRELHL